ATRSSARAATSRVRSLYQLRSPCRVDSGQSRRLRVLPARPLQLSNAWYCKRFDCSRSHAVHQNKVLRVTHAQTECLLLDSLQDAKANKPQWQDRKSPAVG